MAKDKINWEKAHAEFVQQGLTKTAIARKYGVTNNAVSLHVKKEHWDDDRSEYLELNRKAVVTKTNNIATDANYKLYQMAIKTLDSMGDLTINEKTIKSISSALKDIKDVLNCRSELDVKEQEMRIKKMQKELEADNQQHNVIDVTFAECEEYTK